MRYGAALACIVAVGVVALSARRSDAQSARDVPLPDAGCQTHDESTAGVVIDRALMPALASARTVFVITGPDGSEDARWTSELHHELQRWPRWEQVERREAADVTLSISHIHGESGGSSLSIAIRARATGAVLWVSSGNAVTAALKSLEGRLPSPHDSCPDQATS